MSYGLPPEAQLPRCGLACPFRFSEESGQSHLHRSAIRVDQNSAPGQKRVSGYLRAAIPQGLFQILDRAHQAWLCECDDHVLKPRRRDVHALPAMHNDANHGDLAMMTCQACQHFASNNLSVKDNNSNSARLDEMSPSQKWWLLQHARYGHAGYKRMRSLLKHRNIPNLKFSDMPCKACMESKACRKAHTGRLPRASYAMQIVHTDVQGPFQVPALDGNYYQAILVDDYTHRKWSLILRTKDEYGAKLKEWLASLHTPPETMRSDFGGEFVGKVTNQFLQVCAERGIHPEKSLPHESPQNGKAERPGT